MLYTYVKNQDLPSDPVAKATMGRSWDAWLMLKSILFEVHQYKLLIPICDICGSNQAKRHQNACQTWHEIPCLELTRLDMRPRWRPDDLWKKCLGPGNTAQPAVSVKPVESPSSNWFLRASPEIAFSEWKTCQTFLWGPCFFPDTSMKWWKDWKDFLLFQGN